MTKVMGLEVNRTLVARAEAVMDRRARGDRPADIASAMGLDTEEVLRIIQRRRDAGDERAIGHREAQERREAGAVAPLPVMAPDERRAVQARVVRKCEEIAARYVAINPDAAAGMLHLSDLYRYCGRKYPEHSIRGEDVVITRIDRPLLYSPGTSPAAACTMAD